MKLIVIIATILYTFDDRVIVIEIINYNTQVIAVWIALIVSDLLPVAAVFM